MDNKGFTLMEVMVTIVVFSIVMLTLFSSFQAFVSSGDAVTRGIHGAERARTALERMREDLIHMIVHDLRSPLTAVTASLKLLNDVIPATSEFAPLIKRTTEASMRAVRKLLNLVDSLLDIAKMESGQLTLEIEPIELATLVDSVCVELSPLAHELEVTVNSEVPDALPLLEMNLDDADRPLGLVHESDIKDFIYSAYGRDLMVNRAFARQIRDFVRPCPLVDIHDPIDRLLEAYSATSDTAGVLITRDGRYQGFIAATSLLKLVEQKNLAVARDQNPLTKLPGNNPIHRYVSQAISERDHSWHLAYIDFDNFKAFNDYYGFRRGDRAIQLFADLLRAELEQQGWFVGHVGGDDFFAGIRDALLVKVLNRLERLLEKFRIDVQSLYDPEDRRRGYLQAKDRYGQLREMPLMRCSLALLEIRPGDDYSDGDELGRAIAALKHAAKQSASGLVLQREPNGLVLVHVMPDPIPDGSDAP